MKILISNDQANNLYNELNKLNLESHKGFCAEKIELYTNILNKYIHITDQHRKTLQEDGYLEFSNLPLDKELCPPPSNASRPYNKGYISEMIILSITKACGVNPFSYLQEKKGALVHEITPVRDNIKSVSSEGLIDFDFHTDGAYLSRNIRPHTLSLMCLEDTKQTATNIVKLNNVLKNMDKITIETLTNKNFIHTAPETFKVSNKNIISSVLDRVDGQYEIKASLHNIKPINEEAKLALANLRCEINNNIYSKYWKKGDLIIFNNLKCMHGRGEIKGSRWLQRCYGSYSFSPSTILSLD